MIAALSLLAALAVGADPTPEQLAKARGELASTDVAVRREAVKHLIHSDLSVHLIPEMRAGLKDADGEVRAVAATAVGNLGAKAGAAVPALIAQLEKDTFKEARETAARALGRIGKAVPADRTAVKPLRKAAADDADPVTRTVALGALAMMNEDVPGQVVALRKFLVHDEALVRMKASHALGMIRAAGEGRGGRDRGRAGEGDRRPPSRVRGPRAGQRRRRRLPPGAGEGAQEGD